MGVRRGVAAAVLGVAVVVAGALVLVTRDGDSNDDGDRGGADERRVEPEGEPFAYPEGDLLVPGEIEGYELRRVRMTEPDTLDEGVGPTTITTWEGEVVAANVVPVASVQAAAGSSTLAPDHRIATVGDRPTVVPGWRRLPQVEPSAGVLAWLATDDFVVTLAGRSAALDDLVRMSEEVEVAADGELTVPGEVVGVIPPSWARPRPGVEAVYERTGGPNSPAGTTSERVTVRTLQADRSVQEAYLLSAAPDGSIRPETHTSCCYGPILPRRTIDVGDREAIAVPLSPDVQMVILHGDQGGVLLFNGGHYSYAPQDETVGLVAEALTAVPTGDFTPLTPPTDTTVPASPG